MENDQTGLPSWASALAAQVQTSFAAQLMQMRAEHERRAADDREAIRTLLEGCSAGARDARVARAQLQDQQHEFEALQERVPRAEKGKRVDNRREQDLSPTRLEARLFFHRGLFYVRVGSRNLT